MSQGVQKNAKKRIVFVPIPEVRCNTPFSQNKNFFKKDSMHQSEHVNRASHILKHLMLMIK